MTKTCCVPNCKLRKDDPGCSNISFFLIPTNEEKKKKWSDSIKSHFNIEIEFNKCSCVCAFHFEEKYLRHRSKILRLSRDAYPTIFDDQEIPTQNSEVQSIEQQDKNEKNISDNSPDCNSIMDTSQTVHIIKLFTSPLDVPLQDNALSITNDQSSFLFPSDIIMAIGDECINSISELSSQPDIPHSQDSSCDTNSSLSSNMELNLNEIDVHSGFEETNDTYKKRVIRKSLTKVDIDSIDKVPENIDLLIELLKNAQKEIEVLRYTRRVQTMRLHRAKKKVKILERVES